MKRRKKHNGVALILVLFFTRKESHNKFQFEQKKKNKTKKWKKARPHGGKTNFIFQNITGKMITKELASKRKKKKIVKEFKLC